MPGLRLPARVPRGIPPPGTFDGGRNFLPEKAWAGFALQQCEMTAAHGHTAKNSVAFSHIDES